MAMTKKVLNGVDVGELGQAIHQFRHDAALGRFVFRVRNQWDSGGHNQTSVGAFYGAKEEHDGRHFTLEADEPALLLGRDLGPNPVEHLLNALATCLTTSLVYHAAGRGIRIEACACELSGQLDIRGFLGVSDEVRKGYQKIEVAFQVVSDASEEELEACARFSPVLDVLTHGTEVKLDITKRSQRLEKAREEAHPS